ncbi:LysR substrate-binding domain-containing protein [Acidimangrovimonas sediminis]|uniref:LysR substrate-binding domain-containing protein n=1 Tax=Acidimangrovimonas sediminis TaxID=2056283 RepID=UPI000C802AF6|nr:LysR substrate-binding domain-containing protein [Acidimangrovimonas sediminis]
MNLRDFEYLVALADHLNFRRAAEVCNVSQPTLSGQIRKLEDELGVALFERAPRNLIVTAAGAEAVARARRILDEVGQLRAATARLGPQGNLRLHLGIFPTLGPYLLPHLVPALMQRFPGMELLLTEEKSAVLHRHLVEGRLDAAVLAMPVEDRHLTGMELFSERFLLAVPSSHPLAAEPAIGAGQLQGQRLMLLEDGHCLRDHALEVCRLGGAAEQDGFRGTSLETIRQMVRAGVGITLLPALACRDGGGTGDLSLVPLRDPRFRRRIGLFWRRSLAETRFLEEAAGVIGQVASDLLRAG